MNSSQSIFFGIYTCRSWSHWLCVPSSKWILATQMLINRNSELGYNDDWHNLPRKWNQEKMVNNGEGIYVIYVISIILTWCIDESSSNESSVHNSVTVARWRSMNMERLLEVLKIDLKYQRMDNEDSCFLYHNNCVPRMSLIHHQSENIGWELADIRLSWISSSWVAGLILLMVV